MHHNAGHPKESHSGDDPRDNRVSEARPPTPNAARAVPNRGRSVTTQAFSHVFWIGGSPCSGKTSITRLLARRYGLAEYHCDEEFTGHQQRATPGSEPRLHGLITQTCDEIWMRTLAAMVEHEIALYGEEFPMILADLLALAPTPVLAEGTALLPQHVQAALGGGRQAIWIEPSEGFQRREYPRRAWIQEVLRTCSDPRAAFANWMNRDVAFAKVVTQHARDLGMRVIVVDGRHSMEQNAAIVAEYFGLESASIL